MENIDFKAFANDDINEGDIMNIEFNKITGKDMLKELFVDCQEILDENLVINGGTLKQSNLIEEDYNWSYLALLKVNDKTLGYALVRLSNYDQHQTFFDKYYYISQIAISKKVQGMGLGTDLLNGVLEQLTDLPVVASVNKGNKASMALFGLNMEMVSQTNNYVRFIDKTFYKTISSDETNKYK